MRHHATFVLLALFFAGLGLLWWAESSGVLTEAERRERINRLLPDLIDTPVEAIRRIEVASPDPDTRITAERREGGGWQLVAPLVAQADPNLVETLVRNLKDLRKSSDSGTIEGDGAPFGLDTPRATVRLLGKDGSTVLAQLEVGKTVRDQAYVRPSGQTGIEVVDARLLGAIGKPALAWRDRMIFRVPSFKVEAFGIAEREARRTVRVQRDERRWRIVEPYAAPADNDKAEGLAAEFAALRVVDGVDGFVENDARDLSKYGLDEPETTLTLTPFAGSGPAQVLKLGKTIPDHPDQRYAVRGDQDDVVRIDVKLLRESYRGPQSLRSKKVLDLARARVARIEVDGADTTFQVVRSGDAWLVAKPDRARADNPTVEGLLARLTDLETSEFLDATAVANPRLDPPVFHVRVWERPPGTLPAAAGAVASVSGNGPSVDLRLGRHDAVKRTVYGQIAGDSTILALPDTILEVLPRNRLGFRDRTVLSFNVADVDRLTVERRGGTATVRSPSSSGAAVTWRLAEPIDAPADDEAVTAMLLTLSGLHAETWVGDKVGDGRAHGFDNPTLRVRWSLRNQGKVSADTKSTHEQVRTLRFGKSTAGGRSIFANIEGEPEVFTVVAGVAAVFEAELHARDVLKFQADQATRVVLRWPGRTLALTRKPLGEAGPDWRPEPGYDPSGFDAAPVDELVKSLAATKTPRFAQYQGEFPADAELKSPRLQVQVWTRGSDAPHELRIGRQLGEGQALGTNAPSAQDKGPVFVVPVPASWNALLEAPRRAGELPDEVFQR